MATAPTTFSVSSPNGSAASQVMHRALEQLDQVILGKPTQLRLAVACLLARGHLLIEDQPGVGKTTLAQALARTLGLGFRRVQFTSDLLPADLLGVSIWDAASSTFRYQPGPIFPSCCSPTKSTARPRAPRAPCSKRWRSGRCPKAA